MIANSFAPNLSFNTIFSELPETTSCTVRIPQEVGSLGRLRDYSTALVSAHCELAWARLCPLVPPVSSLPTSQPCPDFRIHIQFVPRQRLTEWTIPKHKEFQSFISKAIRRCPGWRLQIFLLFCFLGWHMHWSMLLLLPVSLHWLIAHELGKAAKCCLNLSKEINTTLLFTCLPYVVRALFPLFT